MKKGERVLKEEGRREREERQCFGSAVLRWSRKKKLKR